MFTNFSQISNFLHRTNDLQKNSSGIAYHDYFVDVFCEYTSLKSKIVGIAMMNAFFNRVEPNDGQYLTKKDLPKKVSCQASRGLPKEAK